MKNKIILGTQGTQPFKIEGSYVSKQHAEIIIDDNDIWTLRDLNSTNGTYVRNEDTGELMRISNVVITPMTFICLGSELSLGCCFYAKQAVKYGDFSEELLYMRRKEISFDEEEERLKKKNNIVNIAARIGVGALVLGLTFLITRNGSELVTLIRIVLTGCATYIVPFFFDVNKYKKQINSKREHFRKCPNPMCSHTLTSKESLSMYCSKCQCH